jgi:hypothetical protein
MRGSRLPWVPMATGVVLSVLIRLRAFWSPLTADEGGFLAIARSWAHGKVLYRDVWVDRPQGLLVLFRVWDWMSGGSAASLRILAMIFGAGLVLAVGAATTVLAGRTAGGLAAVLVGVCASSPAIEGHIANGELLSGAVAVAGFALAAVAVRRRGNAWRLYVMSGVLGGCALSIKQSGYEGLLALGLWMVIAVVARRRTLRHAAAALSEVAAGVLAVIGTLAIHGALTGWSRWWFAVAGYRLGGRSALEGAAWNRFFTTARVARPVIWPLLALCLLGGMLSIAFRDRGSRAEGSAGRALIEAQPRPASAGPTTLLLVWPVAASIAFVTGGQFHRHYWLTLCPSLCALAAGLLCRSLRAAPAYGLALLTLVPTAVNTTKILRLDHQHFPVAASGDPRPIDDERLASWFRGIRTPGDEIYVMCASAAFYADVDEDPVYPYLWQDNVQMVPGALAKLRALLGSPNRPDYVAIYESPETCDPSGDTATVLAANYQRFADVAGIAVLRRTGS